MFKSIDLSWIIINIVLYVFRTVDLKVSGQILEFQKEILTEAC